MYVVRCVGGWNGGGMRFGMMCLGSSVRRGRFVGERVQRFNVAVVFVLSFGAHLRCSNSTCPKELFDHRAVQCDAAIIANTLRSIYSTQHIHTGCILPDHSALLYLYSNLAQHIHLGSCHLLGLTSNLAASDIALEEWVIVDWTKITLCAPRTANPVLHLPNGELFKLLFPPLHQKGTRGSPPMNSGSQ